MEVKRRIVDFPTCDLCKGGDAFRCPVCLGYYCPECTMNVDTDLDVCEHEKFVPIKGDQWLQQLESKYERK